MSKNLFKHYIALLLTVVMIFAMLPINALAASGVNSHGVPGLTASYRGGEGWESSTGCISGMVKANKTSGCTGDSYSAVPATLTLTNTSGTTALLSFDYAIVLSGGSISINGEAVESGGSFSKKLENNESIEVSMTSNATNEEYTKIAISSLQLAPEQTVSITFIAPTNGSYTVDGTAITTETTITKLNTETFSLAATPASGYKLMGWKYIDSGEYFSSDLTLTTSFSEDHSVCPEFVPSTTPVFQVGKALFTDLNEAVAYSQSSNTAKIALISNGTLPAGNYTIPNGKTLVIPFDEAQTVYTTSPGMTVGSDGKPASHVNPSAFRTLTMASGATITVASGGALCVPSMVSAVGTNSTSWNATPTGKHGRITMNSGSIIDVQSGGKLYAWGYVAGSGNIYARSGSEVWECFQVRCWRGGTATSGMAGNSQKVFPLNQYYVQNIEAPITFYPGAKETVFAAVNMSNQQFGASATFVGSSGMFRLTSGTMTKRFTGTTDRLELTVDGDFTVSPMALSISGLPLVGTLDLDTNDYVLPITNNITIRVNSGNTTFNQDVAFLPGTEMIIANGATVKIASGHKAYVYDQDQWGQYAAGGAQLVVVGYSTVNGTTAKRTAASLIDSKIDVNGTLTVEGQLYTTENGAAIISTEGTGVYNQTADPGIDENTYQATQSGSDITYVSIPITAAKLQNEDGSYVETSDKTAGAVIPYVNGVWGGSPAAEHTLTINYVVPEGFTAPAQYSGTFTEGEEYSVTSPNVEGCTPDTAVVTGTMGNEDVTVTVTYSVNKYTITWKNEDGTVLETDENVPYNSTPSYDGATPVKDSDDTNHYTFTGWDPEIVPVTGPATYTAVFTAEPHTYGTPSWTWTGYTAATATFTCSVCGYSQTVTAEITSDTTPATPTQPGSIVYTATVEFNGNTYTNVETETLTYTGWKIDDNGKTYIIDGEIAYHNQWQTIEDATYWFDDAGYVLDCGIYWLPYPEGYGPDQWNIDNSNQPYTNAGYLTNSFFSIDANGKLEKDANGFRTLPEGTVVHCKEDDETLTESFEIWLVNGEMPWHPGLVTDGTDYYYFPTGYFDAKRAKISGTNYYISKTNELEWPDIWGEGVFSTGLYTFDNEGKLQLLDGLIDKEDKTYYYDHGMLTYAGVIKIGDYFYYVKSDYTIVKDATYYVIAEKTNGLTGAGLHDFDNYGHMFLPNGDPHFTGIIKVDDDNWFYYEDGVKSYAGLIEIDGHLYYVNSQFKVIHNADYPICKTNGLKPQGTYYFDENGWLEEINETLNGIVKEGDKWYYYVDGIKTYAGVFKIGNDFYYAKSDGEVIHGRSYYISKTNGLVEKGQYDFDEEGRMFMYNGIYKNDNGIWIYYVNGVKTYAGVILIDGYYYYVKSDFQVVHDRSYVVNKTNNLVSPGTYQFDAEGHMIIN